MAKPHDQIGRPLPVEPLPVDAATGLQASVDDLVRFALATVGSSTEDVGGRLLPAERVATIVTPAAGTGGAWGLGYSIQPFLGGTLVGHGGDGPGMSALIELVPEQRRAIIFLSNGTNGPVIRSHIRDLWHNWVAGPLTFHATATPMALLLLLATWVIGVISALVERRRGRRAGGWRAVALLLGPLALLLTIGLTLVLPGTGVSTHIGSRGLLSAITAAAVLFFAAWFWLTVCLPRAMARGRVAGAWMIWCFLTWGPAAMFALNLSYWIRLAWSLA